MSTSSFYALSKWKLRISAVAVVVLFAAGACSSTGGSSPTRESTNGASTSSSAPTAISVYLSRASVDWPFNIAKHEGYFAAEGLDVTINYFDSGATASTSFRAANGTFIQAGDLPSVTAISQGGITMIANTVNIPNGQLLITSTNITDASQLKGKKIGVGLASSSGYFIEQYLEQNHLSDQVDLVDLSLTDGPAALLGGSVDAIVSFPSFATNILAQESGKLHVLAAGKTGNYLMVNNDFLKSHPAAVEGFLKSLTKAGRFIADDLDKAADIEASMDGVTAETAKSWLDPQWGDISNEPEFSEDDYETLSQLGAWALKNKLVKSSYDACESLDLSPLAAASPEGLTMKGCPPGSK